MAFTAGMRLGRYEILAPLGKGGMGEVYRAKDTQLGREVAIKVLPEHLASNSVALKRFEREAMAVAALSHPNILDIHDSGTQEGVAYAVMELLTGETLRSRLSELTMRRSIEIAIAIAEGLAAAHSKGIIHRDLKPENIFLLKDGRVKILDFGLARQTSSVQQQEITEAPTESQLTKMGSVMGTVPYMSPEQVRGESLDARSDIFSLGSILYEMLSGKKAFSGKTANETMAAILRDQPARLPEIPQELQRIVERCLAKNPDERFHSAHDLAFSLKDILKTTDVERTVATSKPSNRKTLLAAVFLLIVAIVAGWWMIQKKTLSFKPSEKIQSIAVLPLTNLSGDQKQEYFADGMTEELIAKLARIASLRVISRTSVMEYKNARKPLPQIAKELNVDAIVEGSVLQAGDRVRITAQLIHAETDRHLWANSYERDLRDILSLQNEVASAIAKEVQIKLAPEEAAQLASAPKVNPGAYEAYLRGLSYSEGEVKEENNRLAIEMFQRAVDLDPGFALAWAALSKAQSFSYFAFQRRPEQLEKSKESIDRALQLQPGFAEGQIALGYYYYWGFRDYDRALAEWSLAEKKLPNNKSILTGKGATYRRQGKFEASLEAFHKVLEIDPRSSTAAYDLGTIYSMIRRYEEAERFFQLSISLKPDDGNGYSASALNHIFWKGDVGSARTIIAKAPQKSRNVVSATYLVEIYGRDYDGALQALSSPYTDPRRALPFKGIVYKLMNQPDLALNSFEDASRDLEKQVRIMPDDHFTSISLSLAYAGLGRKEDAIREAKRAVDILPVSKDALWGPDTVDNLAVIYALVGEKEAAIDQIEYLLSIPSRMTIARLRIDPRFDSLRDHPRFQKLVR